MHLRQFEIENKFETNKTEFVVSKKYNFVSELITDRTFQVKIRSTNAMWTLTQNIVDSMPGWISERRTSQKENA